ncbi:MAG: glycosyltransferase family 9 protein [Opitutaceae bacterium]|nr:glycosyltransferase family 9 protein [Opitutaceae bacterium]
MPPSCSANNQAHFRSAKLGAVRLIARLALLRIAAWLTRRKLIVVTLTEHFGDIVACEPVVGHLRQAHPRVWLVWVCSPRYVELVQHHPGIDSVATVPCLTSWIIARRYHIAARQIDLHVNGRFCPVCLRALENPANPAITLNNYYRFGSLQQALAQAAGLPPLDEQPALHFPEGIDARIAQLGLLQDYVVIHAKSNEAVRDWPLERWPEVARRIRDDLGLTVVEIGLKSVLATGSVPFVDLCGKLSFLETARVIQHARLFVGIDSGPAQLANAVRCPGVLLLGQYRGFDNYQPHSGYYRAGGATILRAAGTLQQLAVDEVAAAVEARLADSSAHQAGTS